MEYEYYRTDVNDKRFVKGSERVVPEFFDFISYKRKKVRSTWNKQPITYYVATLVGLDRLAYGESPEVYVYIGEETGKALQKIEALLSIYEEFGVLKALQNYQFISHTIGYSSYSAGKYNSLRNIYKRFESQHQNLCDYDKKEFILRCHSNSKTANENEIRKMVDRLVKHADGLIEELSRFRIDLSKLRKRIFEKSAKEESFISALGLPPMLQKAIMIGGVIIVKAAARTIGSDANIDFDFDTDTSGIDVPDVDFDSDSSNSIFNFDNGQNQVDVDTSSNNIAFGHAPNNGSYSDTGKDVYVRTTEGHPKGFYSVYLHNGEKWIDFNNTWVRIDNNNYFSFGGNRYEITK